MSGKPMKIDSRAGGKAKATLLRIRVSSFHATHPCPPSSLRWTLDRTYWGNPLPKIGSGRTRLSLGKSADYRTR